MSLYISCHYDTAESILLKALLPSLFDGLEVKDFDTLSTQEQEALGEDDIIFILSSYVTRDVSNRLNKLRLPRKFLFISDRYAESESHLSYVSTFSDKTVLRAVASFCLGNEMIAAYINKQAAENFIRLGNCYIYDREPELICELVNGKKPATLSKKSLDMDLSAKINILFNKINLESFKRWLDIKFREVGFLRFKSEKFNNCFFTAKEMDKIQKAFYRRAEEVKKAISNLDNKLSVSIELDGEEYKMYYAETSVVSKSLVQYLLKQYGPEYIAVLVKNCNRFCLGCVTRNKEVMYKSGKIKHSDLVTDEALPFIVKYRRFR